MTVSTATIRATLINLVSQRGPSKTICPSEVARALSTEGWRDLMPAVRAVGADLVKEGRIVIRQKGQVIAPNAAKGPIRYGLPGDSGTG